MPELGSKVGLVAYAFGADPSNPVNQSLANIVARQYEAFDGQLLVAAQDEVAQNLEGKLDSGDLISVGMDHSRYVNTADVAVEALFELHDRTELLVAAQSLHAVRARLWTRRLASGLDIARVSLLPDLPRGYAPEDPQEHVRSLGSFLPREALAFAYTPVILGQAKRRLSDLMMAS